MNIQVRHIKLKELSAPAFFIPAYEDENRFDPFVAVLDEVLGGTLSRLAKTGEISGKFGEYAVIHPETIPVSHILAVGVGKRENFGLDKFRGAVAKGGRIARRLKGEEIAVPVGSYVSLPPGESAQGAVEGIFLGSYQFRKYKKSDPDPKEGFPKRIALVVKDRQEVSEAEKGGERGKILAEAANFSRDLVNEPSNFMTPAAFAREAQSTALKFGFEAEILDEKEIRGLEMGGLLCVAKGSHEKPKLVILKYRGADGSPFTLGLVGKGVTFDSGGISIKPSENMHFMINDMAGAAACLGAMRAIAELKIPINVVAVLPLAENLPGGSAYKPGDIVKMHSGKTVEIINTDAEGRMLLADALAYIRKLQVSAIIDLATLTGGAVVALGHAASIVFSTHDSFADEVLKAGEQASEKLWRFPLYEDYGIAVKSNVADLKNSAGRYASPCTAAAFLREFVENIPWVHVDIAGTAMVESDKTPYRQQPYLPKNGGTGVGVRTLALLAERLSRKKEPW